jgi:hypothetical protein
VEPRNWLFVTGSEHIAGVEYGTVYAVFPIGDFEWLSSPDITDLFTIVDNMEFETRQDEEYKNLSSDAKKDIVDEKLRVLINTSKWEFNTHLTKCIKSEKEIMVKADKFYMIRVTSDLFTDVIEPLLK